MGKNKKKQNQKDTKDPVKLKVLSLFPFQPHLPIYVGAREQSIREQEV